MDPAEIRAGRRCPSLVRLCLAALVPILAACGEEPAWLRVGTNPWPGYAPLYLAQDLGYFADRRIRLVDLASSTGASRALADGALEAAALTLDEALRLRRALPDLRIVLVLDISAGGDALLVPPEIREPAQLRRKRIGVESTAVGAYLLTRFLERNGLGIEDVQPVWLAADEHESAFREGRVDAVVTHEPMRTRLLRQGARVLFDSRALPGEIVDVLVVRGRCLERQPGAVRTLAEGWFRALDFLAREPTGALERMAPRLGLGTGELKAALQGLELGGRDLNRRLLGVSPTPLLQTARAIWENMRRWELVQGPPPEPGPDLVVPPREIAP